MKYTTRFNDAPWMQEKREDIIIGGAGGIGSWVSLSLGRTNHNLYIYDMDRYDENNLGGQFCKTKQVGINKAEALANNLNEFSVEKVTAMPYEYTNEGLVCPIMIAGFDNMEARKLMYTKWKNQKSEHKKVFIDARMTAEFFEVLVITNEDDEKRYEKDFLFPSSEANELPCSFKSTTHNAMGCAYLITGLLNNYLVGDYKNGGIRELPFHTRMDVGIMMFETNM